MALFGWFLHPKHCLKASELAYINFPDVNSFFLHDHENFKLFNHWIFAHVKAFKSTCACTHVHLNPTHYNRTNTKSNSTNSQKGKNLHTYNHQFHLNSNSNILYWIWILKYTYSTNQQFSIPYLSCYQVSTQHSIVIYTNEICDCINFVWNLI